MASLYNLVKVLQQHKRIEKKAYLQEDDFNDAWKILFGNTTSLTKNEVLEQLKQIDPHISMTEVNKLVGPGSLTKSKLEHLLLDNHHKMDMEMVSQKTYQHLDPYEKGQVPVQAILDLLKEFKPHETFNEQDIDVVTYLMGLPKGKEHFTEAEFGQIGDWKPEIEVLTASQRKMLTSNTLLPNNKGKMKRRSD
mmetsp:Transcript_11917/g.21377  ORF Transcript_11917/g.21377 Transcript_11917/m.21377 type:complete len:193 (-) Transcript_11917:367-945(-)|eukprot:CAMPEP_0175071646 /NCGR_PEP_ID=MMETSP0052_2-20121109/19359_1 /TAXON_ID=51329 ORGANISM="Polytomella parva, Strain SAG 63-3" /NCGR_SAMPLE_ID=MMETSP0052_2 /ASSEMBLY_ACC=CAM_ASM_000194 /LENGTH=192 /DNA_ID=CAMNT_0016338841 /DNA_START=70 /DNA_END=648 /DNA_ORIENTATION=-